MAESEVNLDIPEEHPEDPEPSTNVEDEGAKAARAQAIVTDFISEMRVTREEVLRATPVREVLAWFGFVLRSSNQQDLFHLSKCCQEIGQFLTHSWHGGARKKVFLLLVMYNGLAALVVGTLAAFGMLPLVFNGYLPPLGRLEGQRAASGWCILAGSLAALCTLVLWRPRKGVFLDKICINQTDAKLKQEGLLSLGGFLKHSREMLVCWDETYCMRLWCTFEVGAFLKSHGESHIIVRPTFLGACAFCVFMASAASMLVLRSWRPSEDFGRFILVAAVVVGGVIAVFFAFAASAFRHYFRCLDEMHSQLSKYSLDGARCFCCDVDHVSRTGSRMVCDREIIRDCCTRWFNSVEEFEHSMQSAVLGMMLKQLGRYSFPYFFIVGCTTPCFWSFLDELVGALLDSDGSAFASTSLYIFGWWFGGFPVLFLIVLTLTHKLRKAYRPCISIPLNLVCMWIMLPIYFAANTAEAYLRMLLNSDVGGRAIFATLAWLAAGLLWRVWLRMEKTTKPPTDEKPAHNFGSADLS